MFFWFLLSQSVIFVRRSFDYYHYTRYLQISRWLFGADSSIILEFIALRVKAAGTSLFPANSVKRAQLVEKIHQWRTRHLNLQILYFPLRHKQLCPLPLLHPLRNVGSGIRGCALKENLTKHVKKRMFFFSRGRGSHVLVAYVRVKTLANEDKI